MCLNLLMKLPGQKEHQVKSSTFRENAALPSSPKKKDKNFTKKLSGQMHSLERDSEAVSYHYDMSNELYSLWLDPQMVYSCAGLPLKNFS
ncbi:hypothetical protein MASR2M39_28180 [Ignavibacteriales bacterium]